MKIEVEPVNLKKEPFIMKYKTPERLIELSQPRIRSRMTISPKKDYPNLSSMMIYETSPRLLELAKPKRIEKFQPKETYHIPQKVLRAQASNRIIQLSQPRKYNRSAGSNNKNLNKSKITPEIVASRSMKCSTSNFITIKKKNKDYQLPWLKKIRKDSIALSTQPFPSKNSIIESENKNIVLTNSKFFQKKENPIKRTLKRIVEKKPVFK
ncbi:PREDICTED: uncharacterized protein LOC105367326 isoform X2 [Ceratosolen solmsi marchali]|nr:PREDICTED: uncharacterized protein LOC105367326 isoform X2 [Ceratosolen solmsi marchali]